MRPLRTIVSWLCFLLLSSIATTAASPWQNGSEPSNSTDAWPNSGLLLSASTVTGYGNATGHFTTGSGLEYASSCNSAKVNWFIDRGSSLVSTTTFQTSTPDFLFERSTCFTTTTSLAPGATPYTLCDGYARIDGTTNFSISVFVTSSTTFSTFQTETEVYANVTAPPCLIQSSDCAYLNSSYYKTSSAYRKWRTDSINAYLASQPFTMPSPPEPSEGIGPICGPAPAPLPATTSLIPPVCIVNTAHVQLLYWPVTTASDCDLCDMAHCATQTASPTIPGAPNTIVTFDTTLTSPTVYIAFEGELIGTSDGQTFLDVKRFLVPQSSTAISSYCGKIGGGIEGPPQPFNFAHLDGHVPASAYRCQPRCFTHPLNVAEYTTVQNVSGKVVTETSVTWSTYATENLCSTIWNDYDPMLSIPPEVSTMLFSEGSSGCNFTAMEEGVLFDPPLALTQAAEAAKPTLPVGNAAGPTDDMPSPTAQPGDAPGATLPEPTGIIAPEQASPTAAPPQPDGDEGNSIVPTDASGEEDQEGSNDEGSQIPTPSRDIGGIIASAFGMTKQSDGSPPRQGNAAPTAADSIPDPHHTPDEDLPSGDSGSNDSADDTEVDAQPPAPIAILTGSNNVVVTVVNRPSANEIAVGSSTVPVGQTVSVSGIGNIAADPSGVVVDGTSYAFTDPNEPATQQPLTAGAIVQGSDGQVVTVARVFNDRVVIGSITMSLGDTTGIVGIGGIAVQTDAVVIDGTTHAFSALPATQTPPIAAIITAGSHAITAAPDGDFVIAPEAMLTPGGEVVVSGTTYSLDPEGSIAVVNGVPQTVSKSALNTTGASGTTTATSGSDGGSTDTTADPSLTSGPLTQGSTSGSGSSTSILSLRCCLSLVWALTVAFMR